MEYFDGMDKGVLPDLKVTVLPLGQEFAPGPVTDEQLAALGLGNADVSLASTGSTDARASASELAIEPRHAPMDTPSATALPIDTCMHPAPTCEGPSTVIARIEPLAAAQDHQSADVQVAGVIRPIGDIDWWQAIAIWLLAGERYEGGQEHACSLAGC
jgi:hypothetical protein